MFFFKSGSHNGSLSMSSLVNYSAHDKASSYPEHRIMLRLHISGPQQHKREAFWPQSVKINSTWTATLTRHVLEWISCEKPCRNKNGHSITLRGLKQTFIKISFSKLDGAFDDQPWQLHCKIHCVFNSKALSLDKTKLHILSLFHTLINLLRQTDNSSGKWSRLTNWEELFFFFFGEGHKSSCSMKH